MISVEDATDYLTVRLIDLGIPLNVLKLHKLLYYVQAWHLAFYERRCFNADFQAWVHGPVCRPVYDRFLPDKTMYSRLSTRDVRHDFNPTTLSEDVRSHLEGVIEIYGSFTDYQLEELTHRETPWIEARANIEPTKRSENVISDGTMANYYKSLIDPKSD